MRAVLFTALFAVCANAADDSGFPLRDLPRSSGFGNNAAVDVRLLDMDLDGHLDAVLENHAPGILYGDGRGTFDGPAIRNHNDQSFAGDLDGDGLIDLIELYRQTNQTLHLRWRRNLGGRQFAASARLSKVPDLGSVSCVAVADFTGDGRGDLLIDGYPYVLLQQEDGSFEARAILARHSESATGDVDGDGDLDAVVGGYAPLSLLRNDGRGNFAVTLLGSPASPTMADIDRDGRAEILALGNGELSIFRDADLSNPVIAWTGRAWFGRPITADFNGDANVDIAASIDGRTLVFIGDGRGDFLRHTVLAGETWALASGDVNEDGLLDLVLSDRGLAVVPGKGDGTFQYPRVLPAPGVQQKSLVDAFDRDGDGIDELHLEGWSGRQWAAWIGSEQPDGTYTIERAPDLGLGRIAHRAFGELGVERGDEMVLVEDDDLAPRSTRIRVATFTPAGWRQIFSFGTAGRVMELKVVDLRGNGIGHIATIERLDVYYGDHQSQYLRIYDIDGRVKFTSQVVPRPPDSYWSRAHLDAADVDGDNVTDIVVTSYAAYSSVPHDYGSRPRGGIQIFRGRGNGSLLSSYTVASDLEIHSHFVGDENGDGHADIGVLHEKGGATFLNDGTGRFSMMAAEHKGTSTVTADLDFDGIVDRVHRWGVAYGMPNQAPRFVRYFTPVLGKVLVRRGPNGAPVLMKVLDDGFVINTLESDLSRRRSVL